jgi:two-component system phosphate regulon sensor histidine kinase PhoR
MSSLASHYEARGLRRLLERARDLAEGRERGRIVLGSGDELAGIAGSFNRLSDELQRVVAALAQERDRFQAVLEGMEEAVLALDRERRLVLANGAARALLGLGEGALGRTLLETARVPELSALAQAAWEGKQHTAELTLSGPPPRQVLARATPLKAGPGVVLVLRDISELRRLETVRRDFVANASHELRTPVAVIRANAETLLDGALDDPQRARLFLEAIGRNAERLGRLVADVLDVSRLESGAYPLEVQEVELARVVTAAAGALETAIAERGHSLRLDVPPGLTARCDAAALEHALFNLLDNAIKHTPPGSHLEVGCATEEAHVTLTVADDGPGIAPPHRERVFERFYRVDPARSREAGGTGLGLAIVKHLVQAMEGQVGLAPNSPTGSRFFVRLPR